MTKEEYTNLLELKLTETDVVDIQYTLRELIESVDVIGDYVIKIKKSDYNDKVQERYFDDKCNFFHTYNHLISRAEELIKYVSWFKNYTDGIVDKLEGEE